MNADRSPGRRLAPRPVAVQGLPPEALDAFLRAALAEDLGSGDITTEAVVPEDLRTRAAIVAKSPCTVAGLDVAARVFHLHDPALALHAHLPDGAEASPGESVLFLEGRARSILAAERTALNILGRLSGIATMTRRLARLIEGRKARVLDTRKTTPGFRALEKHAVRLGGGENHRFGLHDRVLIKENHVAAAGSVGEAVRRAREAGRAPGWGIEVEVRDLAEAEEAIAAGADVLLLDNMTPAMLRDVVERAGGRVILEASGNVSEKTIKAIADAGVDYISVGALTHSAPSADFSLLFETETP
jgi:nicotinate-nucleotide pyrophosphorylase (carboxylating)